VAAASPMVVMVAGGEGRWRHHPSGGGRTVGAEGERPDGW